MEQIGRGAGFERGFLSVVLEIRERVTRCRPGETVGEIANAI